MISINDLMNLWNQLVSLLTGRPFELNLPVPRDEEKTYPHEQETVRCLDPCTPSWAIPPIRCPYERVTVRCIAPGRYKLLYSPNRVEGLAAGDVFVLAPKEERGFRVVARGGNLCVWFDFDARYDKNSPEAMELCRSVEALGGVVDGKGAFSLTFTIPNSAGLAHIDDRLGQAARRIPWLIYYYGSTPNEDAP